jgi:hypothetical protein
MSAQHYSGGCQCGAVRFEVTADLDHTITCNCSRCSKLGSILAFAPPESFKLVSGADALTDFQFNNHVIHHLFCRACGIESFARGTKRDGTPMVAVNARCLDGVDTDLLHPMKVDGRSF